MSIAKPRRLSKDHDFTLHINDDGSWPTEKCQIAVLMDIRDELKRLNAVLHCPNFLGIPRELRLIKERLPRRRKSPTAKKRST